MSRNKYNARKAEIDGITFDSHKEAQRYAELKLLLRGGEIRDLRLQVKYELIPKQNGERACEYIADFVYQDARTGETVVEDVKGCKQGAAYNIFAIKRKLMLWRHGIKVVEI